MMEFFIHVFQALAFHWSAPAVTNIIPDITSEITMIVQIKNVVPFITSFTNSSGSLSTFPSLMFKVS